MPAWVHLAWSNRARVIAFAKGLKLSRRTWIRLGGLVAVGLGVYLAATYGYLDRWNPTTFSNAQWAQLVVNLTGFGILYAALRSWWGRQDEVWDEVDRMRTQIDELREALWEHEHEIVEAPEDAEEEFEKDPRPDTVNAIPSARPAPPPPALREPVTTTVLAVRSAPISDREAPTVEREIGGRTFQFRS